jgi:hypothetical protein
VILGKKKLDIGTLLAEAARFAEVESIYDEFSIASQLKLTVIYFAGILSP